MKTIVIETPMMTSKMTVETDPLLTAQLQNLHKRIRCHKSLPLHNAMKNRNRHLRAHMTRMEMTMPASAPTLMTDAASAPTLTMMMTTLRVGSVIHHRIKTLSLQRKQPLCRLPRPRDLSLQEPKEDRAVQVSEAKTTIRIARQTQVIGRQVQTGHSHLHTRLQGPDLDRERFPEPK